MNLGELHPSLQERGRLAATCRNHTAAAGLTLAMKLGDFPLA